ncbi:MAG TPA: TldD/PmbA family protein [Micromonosporaceae bacterium]|jgi:predicted Zn-dependent protease
MSIDVASQVVDLVRAASPGAEAEVVVEGGELALTRFANSFIHQNVADATTNVRLRLHVDGRTAAGSAVIPEQSQPGSTSDGEVLGRLVERTLAVARLAPLDPQWPGLAPAAPVSTVPPLDEATAHAEPAQRAARVRDFVAAAGGLEAAGYCSTYRVSTAFANSAGMSGSSVTALAAFNGIARSGRSDGVARLASSRLADLDGARLGARAAAKARSGLEPRELPPGRYEVVLEPTAVVDILHGLALYGFNGKAVNEGRSFVTLGAAQFDSSVSIVDDPFDPRGPAPAFDVEGTPKQRRFLVEAGTSATVAHDRRSGAKAGAPSTGHAVPGGAAYGALPTNLHLLPAGGTEDGDPGEVDGPAADAAVAALVGQVARGLLVSDFWYTRVLDPRTLVMTGLTRNGVWLIEDGVVTGPVQNFRFTQSYPQSLGPGAVLGIGSHSVGVPSDWEGISSRAPALRLASWNFTGNPSG